MTGRIAAASSGCRAANLAGIRPIAREDRSDPPKRQRPDPTERRSAPRTVHRGTVRAPTGGNRTGRSGVGAPCQTCPLACPSSADPAALLVVTLLSPPAAPHRPRRPPDRAGPSAPLRPDRRASPTARPTPSARSTTRPARPTSSSGSSRAAASSRWSSLASQAPSFTLYGNGVIVFQPKVDDFPQPDATASSTASRGGPAKLDEAPDPGAPRVRADEPAASAPPAIPT